ncbi:3-hydroxybutyrate dehydrogenase [Methylocystis sp. IM3]|uniref:3-hydroxybutyrate dehydrogenase n=1 Tax=unclassified Methylocystis TaxID=2625913 RepID=UPI0030F7A115
MCKGKTVLVTGSTRGIGYETARAFAAKGADVVVNGVSDVARVEAVAAEIAREFGVEALAWRADVSDPVEVAAMVAGACARFGGVDILVANAGVQHVAAIEDFPLEQWRRVIETNLSSAFYAMRAVLPQMKARQWGRIILIASAHSAVASPFKSAYVAAKHGLAGLARTAALETAAHGITVNAIAPGYVWTELVERQIPATMAARGMTREEVIDKVLLAAQPTRRFVTPQEVAAFAVFLASEEARAITGAVLPMDGGWTAQ